MSDLRQRKSAGGRNSGRAGGASASTGPGRVKAMILASTDKMPAKVRPYVQHVATLVYYLMVGWDICSPFLIKAYDVGCWAYSMCPEDILVALIGLMMCFFGGTFAATIAAVEAFRMTGWEQTRKNLISLHEDFELVKAANAEDDVKDEDGNGIPDVQERSASENAARKLHLILVSVKDPEKVSSALVGIGASCLSVVAVLRVQFAKTVTLAMSIGSNLQAACERYVNPLLRQVIPEHYRHWIPTIINYTCKTIAISIAWYIQKIISATHSAIRGGLMFSRRTIAYCNKKGYLNINHEETYIDEIVGWTVAAVGVYFQLRSGFTLPFPLNLLLLPFTFMEWLIIYVVSDTDSVVIA